MAIKLPKYQRQVRPTAEAGAVRGDVGSAGAEWGAISQFAQTAGAVVGDYLQKQEAAKESAAKAKYKTDMVAFRQSVSDATDAALRDGMDYTKVESDVVIPMVEQFDQDLRNKGYSDSIMQKLELEWEYDTAKIAAEASGAIQTRLNADLLEQNKQGYYYEMEQGRPEEAQEHLEHIRILGGVKVANETQQLGEYNRDLNSIRQLQTVEEVEAYKIESTRPDHRASLETERANMRNRIINEKQTLYTGTLSGFSSDVKKGVATTQSVDALEAAGANPRTVDNMRKALAIRQGEDNKDALKSGADIVDKYKDVNDKMTMDKAVQEIMKLNLTLTTKSSMIDDLLEAQENMGNKGAVLSQGIGIGVAPGLMMTSQTTSGWKSQLEQDAYGELRTSTNEALALSQGDEDTYNAILEQMVEARREMKKLFKGEISRTEWESKRTEIMSGISSYIPQAINAPQVQPTGKFEGEDPLGLGF